MKRLLLILLLLPCLTFANEQNPDQYHLVKQIWDVTLTRGTPDSLWYAQYTVEGKTYTNVQGIAEITNKLNEPSYRMKVAIHITQDDFVTLQLTDGPTAQVCTSVGQLNKLNDSAEGTFICNISTIEPVQWHAYIYTR